MKTINIAELLKDCPEGMELDCTMYDNLVFCEIDSEAQDYPIITQLPNGVQKWFSSDGRYELNPNAKCVIYPKGETTWEGFVPPCKFKVGDEIRRKNHHEVCLASEVCVNHYILDKKDVALPFFAQDEWELVPNKFDITTLKPFDKVLARDTDNSLWTATLFSHLRGMKFYTAGGWYNQCIPYESNEHLLGKCDNCIDFYKTWE